MIHIYIDVAELNRNKRDEDRLPIMVRNEDGTIEYYRAVCFEGGRVIYYPGGKRIGEDVVRVAVEVSHITMTDPIPEGLEDGN